MEKSLKEIPFAHEIVGVTSRQQLHFVPDADNEPKVGHEIPEPALFRYLLNEELWEQIKGSEVEIPEMLNVLKDIDKESKIVEFETHQSTMGKVEDFNGAFHVFIVFKSTSEADDEVYWWSLEKNLDYIVLQRSRNKENVKNKLDGEPREKVEPVKEGLKGKGTINDLFAMFWANQMILEEYHFIHQCQTLVTFIGKQITQEGYEYQDFFEYPILPDNGRNTKMLNLINILTVAVESCHPLFPLIYLENTDLVDKLRESGKYKMDDTREGCAPLHFAITLEKSKMVQHLLKPPAMNADPTTRNDQGRNALHLAASMFAMKAEIFDALLAHGKVKVNDVDDRGQTALHLAVSTSNAIAVRKLLEKGADPNIVDKDGMSPLHVAAMPRYDNEIIDLLLAQQVNVDDLDELGRTALHWAASLSNVVAVQKLIEKGADPNIADKNRLAPLHVAAWERDNNEVIDLLLAHPKVNVDDVDDRGRTALHWAACSSNDIAVRKLLDKGANPNLIDQIGRSPLHVAAREREGNPMIDLLLEAKKVKGMGDVNDRDERGETALHCAASSSNEITAEHLIKKGADLHCRDNYGFTPLHVAAFLANDMNIIDVLLQNMNEGDIKQYKNDERLFHRAKESCYGLGDQIVDRLAETGISSIEESESTKNDRGTRIL